MSELAYRLATLDDARFVADVETEVHPDDPEDPLMTAHWWALDDTDKVVRRAIATADGADIGYAIWEHTAWERTAERFIELEAELRARWRTPERLSTLLAHLEDEARAEGALRSTTWAWEHDALRIAAISGRGYREERRERFWELDLVAERERIAKMAAESRERMKREGIRVVTLAADTDPRKWERLKRMSDEAEGDVPTTVPFVPMERLDEWKKWWDMPGLHLDRVWIARDGDDIVGISQLSYPPERGVVQTDWTGTARKVRGRGVARALKCETLMQAVALGVTRVRTDNDSSNTPILHINETMGYRRRPDMVQYLKEL